MRKGILLSMLTSSLLMCLGLGSCKKENTLGIDNDQVIQTPYSLYAADSNGAIISTNDGSHFSNVFPPDGYTPIFLLVSGENLMMLKQQLDLSVSNSHSFNPVFSQANKFPWQTMVYNYPAHKRIYIASSQGKGISISEDNGLHWEADTSWEDDNKLPPSFEISSFSGLPNGEIFAYSNEGNVLFLKDGADGKWAPVTTKGSFPTMQSDYYLTSNDSTLFLVDYKGVGGVWYSKDTGIHWAQFDQGVLPTNTTYLCAISPEGGTSLLVGTDSMGVYLADQNSFVEASGGLMKHTTAFSFASKKNYFKNKAVKDYIYVGTKDGLFRSENYGRTWYELTPGALKRSYVAIY